ncbi:hypothetical protein [Sporomusa termitida]|uniref:Uncharacterized protein n=1 Tax=Sporomusa termitida TaxID=2377 RepID=A0A517DNT4_9FIRM|nr:hypothetical protein [Sporomusa termitida]QDR79030.1 hypothetical protein SPTER_02890 [Sporomusa termitida]
MIRHGRGKCSQKPQQATIYKPFASLACKSCLEKEMICETQGTGIMFQYLNIKIMLLQPFEGSLYLL